MMLPRDPAAEALAKAVEDWLYCDDVDEPLAISLQRYYDAIREREAE